MIHRWLQYSAVLFLCSWLQPHGSGAESRRPSKPNIIFILADDLGYGDLGCYGQRMIRTPRLDHMAAEGLRFTQCYAGTTVCAPSRSSLMTGQHTGHTRVRGNERYPLQPGDVTVAAVLRQAGYRTALIGKWGLGDPDTTGSPIKQGFDEFFGYTNQRHAHNYYPSYLWRNEQKVALPNQVANEDKEGAGVSTNRVAYSQDLFTNEALQFLERNQSRPFFLYLAYTLPHANNENKAQGMEISGDAPYSNEPWPQAERNKAAMITRLDQDVGRILDRLRQLGLDANTCVFFASDNGPHKEGGVAPDFFRSSGPFRGIKRDLYEGGIRVPLLVRWPGTIPAGRITAHVCAFWDFLPTAAALAGPDAIPFIPARGIDGKLPSSPRSSANPISPSPGSSTGSFTKAVPNKRSATADGKPCACPQANRWSSMTSASIRARRRTSPSNIPRRSSRSKHTCKTPGRNPNRGH
ncbi:MAG: arylsulfatase [Verrucomicrobiota bacterium]